MTVDASAAGRISPLVERAPALDAEGAALARHTARRTSIAAMTANLVGVVDVFLLLFFVLPSPPGEPDQMRNLVAGIAFVGSRSRSASCGRTASSGRWSGG